MLLDLLQLRKKDPTPLFRQITLQIKELIEQGVVQPGYQLPGSRKLATALNIHRKTVVSALEQLILEGWLETIPGKGTFVTVNLESTPKELKRTESITNKAPRLAIPKNLQRQQHLVTQKYHLDDGLPDPRLAPTTELIRAYKSSLTKGNIYPKFTYGDTKGNAFLRQVLSEYLLQTRGMNVHKDQLLITRGVTQALYLCIQSFLKAGDRVAVGELNWESANVNFIHHGIELIRVKVDHEGLDTNHLEALLSEKEIKMVYLTPHHQYPTTVIMPAARRLQLIQLSRQYGFYLFEDDYDYDFHYTTHPVMPMASADHGDFVLYAGSFTKAISPVFRVGYLVANANQIDYISRIRRMVDRQGDALLEIAIAELLELGIIQRYLKKNRKIYEHRRALLAELLSTYMGDFVDFELPAGGMSFWTHFDPNIDLKKIAQQALQKDLFITSGTQISTSKPLNATRLGFASSNEMELEQAVQILTSLIELNKNS